MVDHTKASSITSSPPEQPKRLACERCRGQKLRCIRNRINQPSCNRCERAGAVCITKPSMRMGRPGRSESQRKENIANQKRRQSSSAPSQPVPDYAMQGNVGIGGGRCNSPSINSTTPVPQGLNCTRAVFTPQLPPGNVQEMPDVEFAPFLFMEDGVNNDFDGDSMPWLNYNAVEMDIFPFMEKGGPFRNRMVLNETEEIEPEMTLLAAHQSPLSPIRDCDVGFQNIVNDFTHLDTRSAIDQGRLNVMEAHYLYHDSLERLTKLNVDVNEQLKVQLVNVRFSNEHEPMSLSPADPALPIAPIIRGLQEFQDLLQNLVNLQNSRSIYELNSEHSKPDLQAAEMCEESPLGSTQCLAALSTSSSPSDDSLLPSIITSGGSDSRTRPTRRYQLDVPTCLSMLMCYINLVRLCRTVFTDIRHYFVALNHRAIATALSDIQISGVSLQGDQSLQILVLVQVVARMLDCIGAILGRTTSNNIGLGNETENLRPLILPKLVEVVMNEEELDRQRPQGGGIRELREDIRKLKRVLGCT